MGDLVFRFSADSRGKKMSASSLVPPHGFRRHPWMYSGFVPGGIKQKLRVQCPMGS